MYAIRDAVATFLGIGAGALMVLMAVGVRIGGIDQMLAILIAMVVAAVVLDPRRPARKR